MRHANLIRGLLSGAVAAAIVSTPVAAAAGPRWAEPGPITTQPPSLGAISIPNPWGAGLGSNCRNYHLGIDPNAHIQCRY